METHDKFYLGRIYDPQQGQVTDQPLLYDPADLTTHAVVVGMTGSGKTGLCIGLLEEAALLGIPALMIDPKGDITNALLHFPDLSPQDFLPWINLDQARREGKTPEQAASEAADHWRQGLAEWDISPQRVRALRDAAEYTVYTPGSDSGQPVSILASLKAPPIAWEGNRELLREKISSTVTALLGLVGLQDVDPVRSRDHILLANIFEHAWSQGRDLDLGELILQAQTPPFSKLGVFDVNTFFPEKDRFGLAMLLNNILAAPAFQAWIEGQPLDIQGLLFTPGGRPRHSVFYIAHLSDAERMFFVTLLYSAVESWMRAQSGTTSLRAILYFDEIYGYMPPVGNPPSKSPMLRMLKQARAFGVGQVLVTQNPVDIDYKALSNAGTWMIGKLQTEQDKLRLLDGLESAASLPAAGLDRGHYDRLISALGKRVFLLHNVHNRQPQLFQTRWAMNYLAGPLTRAQIPALNQLGALPKAAAGQSNAFQAPADRPSDGQHTPVPAMAEFQPIPLSVQPEGSSSRSPENVSPLSFDKGSATRPTLPSGVAEYILPNNLTFTQSLKATGRSFPSEAHPLGLIYQPILLAQAHVRYLNRKYNLDLVEEKTCLVADPDRRGMVHWEQHLAGAVNARSFDAEPAPRARFSALEAPLTDAKMLTALQKDFLDWAYRSAQVTVRANEALKIYAGPDTSQAEFRRLCAEAARAGRDAEVRKLSSSFDKKIDALVAKVAREERELSEDQTDLSQRKWEEMGTHAENILGLFGSRRSSRRLSTSLSKRRMTQQARADVEESLEALADLRKQISTLEQEKAQAIEETNDRWSEIANQVTEVPVAPYKKDVLLDLFGVAWVPYHLVQVGHEVVELPGFTG